MRQVYLTTDELRCLAQTQDSVISMSRTEARALYDQVADEELADALDYAQGNALEGLPEFIILRVVAD